MDDLLDLDFTSSPNLNSAAAPQARYGAGRSAFDYLAKSTSPAAVPPRTAPPNPTLIHPSQLTTNGPGAARAQRVGGDAFSSLFGSTSTPSPPSGPLSMAERLAKDRAASPAFASALAPTSRSSSPALQPSRTTPSPSLPPPQSRLGTPPILRSNAPSPPNLVRSTPAPATKSPDPWDFDLLAANVPPLKRDAPIAPEADPFDLEFDAPPTSSPLPPSNHHSSDSAPREDFDLLDTFSSQPTLSRNLPSPARTRPTPTTTRNASGPGGAARPDVVSPPPELLLKLTTEMGFALVDANRALIETFDRTGRFGLELAVELLMSSSSSSSRAPAPPPAASTAASGTTTTNQREFDEWGDDDLVKVGRRRSWEFEDVVAPRERRTVERQGGQGSGAEPRERRVNERGEALSSRSSKPGTNGGARSAAAEAGPGDMDQAAKALQEQANEVLSQAQKIGVSMFKSANAYWGAGKEALAKKLDEQRKAARIAAGLPSGTGASASSAGGRDGEANGGGKPKWWREGMDLDEDADERTPTGANGKGRHPANSSSGFKDSDDEGEGRGGGRAGPESVLPEKRPKSRPPPNSAPSPAASEYRSPFRRQKVVPTPSVPPSPQPIDPDLLSGGTAPPASRPATSPASRPAQSSPVPHTRPARPRRAPIAVPTSSVQAATSHKATGNSHFKLGRFSDASAAYTLAIESVPAAWVGRVVLLNNRAQSRLKSGEDKGAIDDCTESLEILSGPIDGGSTTIDLGALASENGSLGDDVIQIAGGGQVDLRDFVGKSLGRRAKAFEAIEKWVFALQDWERVRNLGDEVVVRGAGGTKVVADGIARCRKMVDPAAVSSSSASATSRPAAARPRATPSPAEVQSRRAPPPTGRTNGIQGSGEAVKALQAAQALQVAEDDLRIQFKDSVDERIAAWKTSKETNLRALIASLDCVLWPELGWKKVGMNELITESQLKVRYVRAIAKVHPDKLNVGNASVEQRMIAGAVFAALNEAWNATKA